MVKENVLLTETIRISKHTQQLFFSLAYIINISVLVYLTGSSLLLKSIFLF